MQMKLLLANTVLATIAVTGPARAQSVEGLFQPKGATWSCSPDQIGMDGGALAIQNGVFNGVENRCNLTSPAAMGDGTRYITVCSAEGSTYQEPIIITPTANGVKIDRNGSTAYWTRCTDTDQPEAIEVVRNTDERWEYSDRTALIIVDGSRFALSCDTFNASSTYPTASISVPCPSCWPGETTTYTLQVNDAFSQSYGFERISNAAGSVSNFDYAPNWDGGLVQALMAGSFLEVVEMGNVIASFPLAGSSRAIGELRASCN